MQRKSTTLARRAALALATAALATLAPAASALADTTVGQTGGDASVTCAGPTVRADTNYAMPAGGGTVTSFSYESVSANAGQQLDFLVLRAAGGSDYTVVGKSGLVTLAGTGAVETFAANIPAQGGDILGLWHPGGLHACLRFVASGSGGHRNSGAVPADPSVGDTVSLPNGDSSLDLNLSANLVTEPTGNDQPKRDVSPSPSNEFSVVSVKKLPSKGKARVTLDLPGQGLVQLNPPAGSSAAIAANGTKSRRKRAQGAGRLRLNVTATGGKKRKLVEAGKVKVKAEFTFTPSGGEPNTQGIKVGLRKK